MVDSEGQTWAYGPLHSGGQGTTDCLSLSTSTPSSSMPKFTIAIASIGCLFAGILFGGAGSLIYHRRQKEPHYDSIQMERTQKGRTTSTSHLGDEGLYDNTASNTSLLPTQRSPIPGGLGYDIEPFRMPDTYSSSPNPSGSGAGWNQHQNNVSNVPVTSDHLHDSTPTSSPSPVNPETSAQQQVGRIPSNQVYVVHHDAGRAPVTVYTSGGAEVIELPPHYDVSTLNSQTRVEEGRRVGPIPRKQSSSQRMNINND